MDKSDIISELQAQLRTLKELLGETGRLLDRFCVRPYYWVEDLAGEFKWRCVKCSSMKDKGHAPDCMIGEAQALLTRIAVEGKE